MESTQVVLITGGISGIGRASAIAFVREGATVFVSGRRADVGEAVAAELKALGNNGTFIRADVGVESEVKNLVDTVVARAGRIDIAVNAAGTEGEPGPLIDMPVELYRNVFDTNVLGTILSLKYELRAMAKSGSGSIVNISSTMGSRGAANNALYVASKHAVEGLTKTAALEGAAFGVRVNAVAPGPVETAMLQRLTGGAERKAAFVAGLPLKRAGTPEEIAQAILFVGTAQSSFMTGEILRVNGGKTAS